MDSHNISVCVAPSIFHKLDRPSDVESSFQAIAFVKYLIDNSESLFGSDVATLLSNTEQSRPFDVEDESNQELKPTASTKKHKSSMIIHKREIGRMLNLVALKSKKTLVPKLKYKAPSFLTTKEAIKAPQVLNTDSMDNHTRYEDFDKIKLNKEIRRRTSTNNSNHNNELNSTILIINVEGEEEDDIDDEEDDQQPHEDIEHSYNSDDDDDDSIEDEDYYVYDDDDIVATVHPDYSKAKQLRVAKSKYKSNKRAVKTVPIDSNNEGNLSVHNLAVNKHDLSSNTLSVDSGLSVPTATNSDPESEKSTNLNQLTTLTTVVSNKEDLDASRLKLELEKHQQSSQKLNYYFGELHDEQDCPVEGLLNCSKQMPLLKRQRRMLMLNSNVVSVESKANKIAPPPPPPATATVFQKSTSCVTVGSAKKRFAPTIDDLKQITKIEIVNPSVPLDESGSCSSISSKSTSTEPKLEAPKPTTTFYSNHQHHQIGQRAKQASVNRKSLVKVSLPVEQMSQLINFDYTTGFSVQRGFGLASDLPACSSSNANSSTTIYVPYMPLAKLDEANKSKDLVSVLKSKKPQQPVQQQRRKLSKTLKDYKPSRQLQRQLSHQLRDTKPHAPKLTSQSFKQINRKHRLNLRSSSSSSSGSRDTSVTSLGVCVPTRPPRNYSKLVARAKSLNLNHKDSIQVKDLCIANTTLTRQSLNLRTHKAKRSMSLVSTNKMPHTSSIEQLRLNDKLNKNLLKLEKKLNTTVVNKNLTSDSCSSISSNIYTSLTVRNEPTPTPVQSIEERAILSAASAPRTVEITWSVSSIKKQFEKSRTMGDESDSMKPRMSDLDSSSGSKKFNSFLASSHLGTIKINRHTILHPQRATGGAAAASPSTSSTSSISSVSTNTNRHHNYHDSNGNPITYI